MKTYYTTWGGVRGTCGHRHRTPRTALDCRDRDGRACRRSGGYSDRMIVRVPDGTPPGDLTRESIRSVACWPDEIVDERPQALTEYDAKHGSR